MISFVYVSSLIPSEPYTRLFIWISPLVVIPFVFIILKPRYNFFRLNLLEYTPISLFNTNTFRGTIFIVGILIITLLIVCINTLQVKNSMRSYN